MGLFSEGSISGMIRCPHLCSSASVKLPLLFSLSYYLAEGPEQVSTPHVLLQLWHHHLHQRAAGQHNSVSLPLCLRAIYYMEKAKTSDAERGIIHTLVMFYKNKQQLIVAVFGRIPNRRNWSQNHLFYTYSTTDLLEECNFLMTGGVTPVLVVLSLFQ